MRRFLMIATAWAALGGGAVADTLTDAMSAALQTNPTIEA
ncbi:MAG: hypothetical protein FD124_3450, partial [Alphaproteobacteria bacterium]